MLEWYEYFPISYTKVSMVDVCQSLPQAIQQELIQVPETFLGSVAVEAEKSDVIAELDRLLRIDSATKFLKERFVEIEENEISRFAYYYILPMRIEPRHIKYELDEPQCDKCLWGCHLHPPITLSEKIRRKCDFGQAVLARSLDIELIVSERLKTIFDREGISGLRYQTIDDSSFYLAKITELAWQHGDLIIRDTNFCEKHLVGFTPTVIHRTTPVDEFRSDFVMICGVEAGGTNCFFAAPVWYVSRRALEILLREVKGLRCATIRLKEKFKPCLAS